MSNILLFLLELKSDHIGIEMLGMAVAKDLWYELKSDHIGIEIIHIGVHCFNLCTTKIRPYWD